MQTMQGEIVPRVFRETDTLSSVFFRLLLKTRVHCLMMQVFKTSPEHSAPLKDKHQIAVERRSAHTYLAALHRKRELPGRLPPRRVSIQSLGVAAGRHRKLQRGFRHSHAIRRGVIDQVNAAPVMPW